MNTTLSLFDHRPQAVERVLHEAPASVELRPYQVEAVSRVLDQLQRVRSTLLVMATGTGKTTVFADVIAKTEGKCLMLAHRDELIRQGARRIAQQTGKRVTVEKADERASYGAEVVVASVQTLSKDGRLQQFGPQEFALVICDEAHHGTAASYRKIFDHFEGAKILGVTATPDRADEAAMGAVFDDVAYIYEIQDAIRDGYLCRVRATQVLCDAIDLASVKTVAGDLNQGELDAVMSAEKALHQIARPTLELAGGRRTLVFTTSVENAHRLAEVFNRYRPDCAMAVDGGTDPVTRRRTLADHRAGRYQFLCNVGVLTEGYDDPGIACIAMGRPTKSRALYAQMAGRGTRIAPGKDDLLLLDFVGNSGRHALVSAADILAGKHPDEVLERAKKKIAENPGEDVGRALSESAAELEEEKRRSEERRNRIRARVAYQTRTVDPFGVFGVRDPRQEYGSRFGDAPASEAQLGLLGKLKIPVDENMTKRAASRLIGEAFRRREAGLCSFGQARVLQKYGHDTSAMRFETARLLMNAYAVNGWRRLGEDVIRAVVGREPGSDDT